MKNEILYKSLHVKLQEMSDSMNELNGYIGLIRDSDLITEDQKEFKRLLEFSAFRLQNAIGKSLDLLKISAGQIQVSISETNIHDLLGQVYQEFQPLAEKTGIHFKAKVPRLDPAFVIQTDPEILSMIFINLIGEVFNNSITGSVKYGCLSDKNPFELEFFVSDTAHALSCLDWELKGEGFNGSYRTNEINLIALENARSPVKLLVQMLGGTIRLVRNPDKGSTVFFTVPVSLINVDDTPVDGSDPQEIGLIDSGDQVEQYGHWIRNFLAILSHEVRTPDNAVMGYAKMLNSSIDFSPGQQQNLKPIRNPTTHIIQILSNCLKAFRPFSLIPPPKARVIDTSVSQTVDFSMRSIIATGKIVINQLNNILREYQTENQPKKLNILLAEDCVCGVNILRRSLDHLGYNVKNVHNGQEAVAYCRDNPDVDLVLMDIFMPLMDGFEATREIRKFNKELVIIAIGANFDRIRREQLIENGCNDLIERPFTMGLLTSMINKYQPL